MTEHAYDVKLTAAQIFEFSALVRRLTRVNVYGPDGQEEQPLRRDLGVALEEFAGLLPSPSEEDCEAYCDALDKGILPNWDADPLPLTQTLAEYQAALLASVTRA